MIKSFVDVDDVLKNMASESVKQGENLRTTVRDLTLKALQTRELSLAQIKSVLRSVSAGVNLGNLPAAPPTEVVCRDDERQRQRHAHDIRLRESANGCGADGRLSMHFWLGWLD